MYFIANKFLMKLYYKIICNAFNIKIIRDESLS